MGVRGSVSLLLRFMADYLYFFQMGGSLALILKTKTIY